LGQVNEGIGEERVATVVGGTEDQSRSEGGDAVVIDGLPIQLGWGVGLVFLMGGWGGGGCSVLRICDVFCWDGVCISWTVCLVGIYGIFSWVLVGFVLFFVTVWVGGLRQT
jgi:hypothetical protein